MSATEWIEEWLKEGTKNDEIMVQNMRKRGRTDEEIKAFLEGL